MYEYYIVPVSQGLSRQGRGDLLEWGEFQVKRAEIHCSIRRNESQLSSASPSPSPSPTATATAGMSSSHIISLAKVSTILAKCWRIMCENTRTACDNASSVLEDEHAVATRDENEYNYVIIIIIIIITCKFCPKNIRIDARANGPSTKAELAIFNFFFFLSNWPTCTSYPINKF